MLEDIGDARVSVPEDIVLRTRRHALAQQMILAIVAQIAVVRDLDFDIPLTPIMAACAPRAPEKRQKP